MPYTLAKALVWLVLAGVLGVTIGWLLRSVAAKRQLARARSQHGESAEIKRLQSRVHELEVAVADRDHLAADRDRLLRELDAATSGSAPASDGPEPPPPPPSSSSSPASPSGPDLESAAVILGHPIERDDLKTIEGIGPSIEELCHGIGIRTWSDMAATEPSLLRTMLTDAGPRFKMQNPTTWPRQAGLLANGQWEAFRDLVGEIRDGVTSS